MMGEHCAQMFDQLQFLCVFTYEEVRLSDPFAGVSQERRISQAMR